MKHYVCPSCGGVSQVPKVCETNGCTSQGSPLQECTCSEPQHVGTQE